MSRSARPIISTQKENANVVEAPLKLRAALSDLRMDTGAIRIESAPPNALLWIAAPRGHEGVLREQLQTTLGLEWPSAGRSTEGVGIRAIPFQPDQILLLLEADGPHSSAEVCSRLAPVAYTSDQTSGWVILKVSGTLLLDLLERICPLDLHPASFPNGAVARTLMHHLSVTILRLSNDSVVLMSGRSSAEHLGDMVTQAAQALASRG